MSTLWLKFAQDSSLPARMDAQAQARFEALFDASSPDSAWSHAMDRLGLAHTRDTLIYWYHNTPYINWTYTASLISGGVATVAPNESGGFHYKVTYRLARIFALFSSQWKISRYILRCLEPEYAPPTEIMERISESIALGLALLALTMRLPAHTPQQLAQWLAFPVNLPSSLRRNIVQMNRIQQLRTTLSPSWNVLFPDTQPDAVYDVCPEYFWDYPPTEVTETPSSTIKQGIAQWKGLSVSGNVVTGRAVLVTRTTDKTALGAFHEPLILIFPLARPETVEFFNSCAAVVYGEGGTLCHACTIAREQNLACVTGMGKSFISRITSDIKSHGNVWLRVDPTQATVTFIEYSC